MTDQIPKLSRRTKSQSANLTSKTDTPKKRPIIPQPIKRFWKRHDLTRWSLLIGLIFVVAISSYLLFLAKTANVSILKQAIESQTVIYDRAGNQAGSLYGQKGTVVKSNEIAQSIKDAVVATEDRTFYHNKGVNFQRTILAVVTFGRFGGGSTITQQLAKNAYLTQKQTIDRKAREIFLAFEITKKYSKDDILMMYLNNAYYGNGVWGIEDASEKYFGVHASEVTLDQAATLAGILKWPEVYNPMYKEAKFAKDRRDTVLQNMVADKRITSDEAKQAQSLDLYSQVRDNYHPGAQNYKYPSYFDAVLDEAISQYDLSEKDILNNGYQIYTNLDQNMQTGMQTTYANTSLFPIASDGETAQSGTVALDPKTGGVLAMVGRVSAYDDSDFRTFNFATQAKRSPGSTIKPLIVYTPAIEKGWAIDKLLSDEASTYDIDGTPWTPKNADGLFHGEIPMYQALANSYNIPAINTFQTIGIDTGLKKGREFGLKLTDKQANLSTALGSGVETNPLQMAEAYATFANGGIRPKAHLITKILNASGEEVAKYKEKTTRVISSGTADKMTEMMLGTYSNGTGVNAAPYGYQLAGKTGTNEDIDQWVIGYTPDVVLSSWVGFEDPDKPDHRLEDTSYITASNIFRTTASYVLPYTAGTAFTVENAYVTNGIAASGETGNPTADNILDKTREAAKKWADEAKNRVKDSVKERVESFWGRLREVFE